MLSPSRFVQTLVAPRSAGKKSNKQFTALALFRKQKKKKKGKHATSPEKKRKQQKFRNEQTREGSQCVCAE
jgi:hypothetical protein